jgi:thiol-disulfide isomerase/thioredoxin
VPKILVVPIAIACAVAGYLFYMQQSVEVREPLPAPADTVVADVAPPGPVQVEFELAGLDGAPRKFSEWHNKHRIVNFWATWCAPCRREIPLLKAFQDEHAADDFQVIGIAVEFLEPVIAYAEAAEFNYPILVGEQDAMAVAETSGISFVGLPFTMVVAKDGRLVGAHMGEIHQRHLDAIFAAMQRLDAGEIDIAQAKQQLNLL